MIRYTAEFKERVRAAYGTKYNLYLKEGNRVLVKYLEDELKKGISPTKLARAKSMDDVKALLAEHKERIALTKDFWEQLPLAV